MISGGTLQLGNGGASGSIVGNIADNGALVFDRSGVQSFTGVISGSGTVTQAGTRNDDPDRYQQLCRRAPSSTPASSQVAADGNLGAPAGGMTFNGGTLQTDRELRHGPATPRSALAGGVIPGRRQHGSDGTVVSSPAPGRSPRRAAARSP